MSDLETSIGRWRRYLAGRSGLVDEDIEELESHLRDEIDALGKSGLAEDEAFLVAVKRLGNAEAMTREFSRVNRERLWRQLMMEPPSAEERVRRRRRVILVAALCLFSGLFARIPMFFGASPYDGGAAALLYLRNLAVFALPSLCFYFVYTRRPRPGRAALLFVWLILAAVLVNITPFAYPSHTALLAGIHLPIALWLVVGFAYTGCRWSDPGRRMDFVRFSGESFIYAVLLFCGGGVLVAVFGRIFEGLGLDLSTFGREWLIIFGGFAVPMVAAYLVEEKKSVVENMAPVLARIFTPLFLVAMVVLLAVIPIRGLNPFTGRELLIAMDLLLALVVGLSLYSLSARDPDAPVATSDLLTLALLWVALVIDALALSAILFRITSFGFSPNKTAALGENVILLVNLAGLSILYTGFVRRRVGFDRVAKWQTGYLPIYAGWAAVVVALFPLAFRFA